MSFLFGILLLYLSANDGTMHLFGFSHFLFNSFQIIYDKQQKYQMNTSENKQKDNKVFNILFYASKLKSSLQIVHEIYLLIQAQERPIKMYSLGSFQDHFERIICIYANEEQMLKLMDCIIVVGDNQTLMDLVRHYRYINTPPILGIGNGCGPGLYNYTKFQIKQVVEATISKLVTNTIFTQQLMKLKTNINCATVGQSVSQIQIHRGMNQAILILNIYLETEQRCKIKIGQFKGDGLLISTPTGSYCKSLSLNGPLMCKTMESIMITPICPLSMKFRPICLPSSTKIFIQVDLSCRSQHAFLYFDENEESIKLSKGESLRIKMSKSKVNLISNLQQSSEQLFIKSLKNILNWGENYSSVEHESIMKHTASFIE